jgi:hypothetical protein
LDVEERGSQLIESLCFSDPDEAISDDSDDSDEDDEDKPAKKQQQVYKVDVDISTTAFANARNYYDVKKSTAAKHEKTIAATSKVTDRKQLEK